MYHIPSEKSSTFRKITQRIFLYSPFPVSSHFFRKKTAARRTAVSDSYGKPLVL